jgi:DNA-directed RNA polymerase specialized sigma24 family protein
MENRIRQEVFETLLNWLAPDPNEAGARYEKIRSRLIRLFSSRGCTEPEELADETINRVLLKIPQIRENYIGEPALYFYRVADKIHLEWLRKPKKPEFVPLLDIEVEEAEYDKDSEILEQALNALPAEKKDFILEYYSHSGREKIESRKQLAEKLGLSRNALHLKAVRIRAILRSAVISGRKREESNAGEEHLISQIKNIFPDAERRRYDELNERFLQGTITASENDELLKLSDKFEKLNSTRLEYLSRLARLRGQTLTQLKEKLEI